MQFIIGIHINENKSWVTKVKTYVYILTWYDVKIRHLCRPFKLASFEYDYILQIIKYLPKF